MQNGFIRVSPSGEDVITKYVTVAALTAVEVLHDDGGSIWTVRLVAGSNTDVDFDNEIEAQNVARSLVEGIGLAWEWPGV